MKKKEVKKKATSVVREASPIYEAGPRWTKFATQVDPAVLARVRHIAKTEGRQVQSLVDDALREYLERRDENYIRPDVMAHFQASLAEHDELYRLLAK